MKDKAERKVREKQSKRTGRKRGRREAVAEAAQSAMANQVVVSPVFVRVDAWGPGGFNAGHPCPGYIVGVPMNCGPEGFAPGPEWSTSRSQAALSAVGATAGRVPTEWASSGHPFVIGAAYLDDDMGVIVPVYPGLDSDDAEKVMCSSFEAMAASVRDAALLSAAVSSSSLPIH